MAMTVATFNKHCGLEFRLDVRSKYYAVSVLNFAHSEFSRLELGIEFHKALNVRILVQHNLTFDFTLIRVAELQDGYFH